MTKSHLLILLCVLFLFSCKNFKELEPNPPIKAVENQLTPVKDEKDDFELAAEKGYHIKFPAPTLDEFYLVLDVKDKSQFTSILTNEFDDDKKEFVAIEDESSQPNTLVYSVPKNTTFYYWVIKSVPKDQFLKMEYRYVPKWRYKFELTHLKLNDVFASEKVSRETYESIGKSFNIGAFDYASEITKLTASIGKLEAGQKELDDIATVIPEAINKTDAAYVAYIDLNERYKEEIAFQKKYLKLLESYKVFGNVDSAPTSFLDEVNNHVSLLKADKGNYSPEIIKDITTHAKSGVRSVVKDLDLKLKNMSSAKKIDWNTEELLELATEVGESVNSVKKIHRLRVTNNYILDELESIKKEINDVTQITFDPWPSNSFYANKIAQVNVPLRKLSKVDYSTLNAYKNYGFVKELRSVLSELNRSGRYSKQRYSVANESVSRINQMKLIPDYKGIIREIQTSRYTELKNHYRDVDQRSLAHQKRLIEADLESGTWVLAEQKIQALHQDKVFLSVNGINGDKVNVTIELEQNFSEKINSASRARLQQFTESNNTTYAQVAELYKSPVFVPVHSPTYVSLKRTELKTKLNALVKDLTYAKHYSFPEQAITALYDAFSKNMDETAVYQARAIQVHRNFYKGKNARVLRKIHLSNTEEAKRVTDAAKWGKNFVLPISNKEDGTHKYVYRLDLQVQSKAKFPVWDVTLKLPKEIGEQAEFRKWFTQMKMGGKVLKNEGRFSISAPDPKDSYKVKITPVQAKKGQTNIFEITFTHPKFKVFEISAMVQRPIIKK